MRSGQIGGYLEARCLQRLAVWGLLPAMLLLLGAAPMIRVRLPFRSPQPDALGNRWMLALGRISQVGNQPMFSELASLKVSDSQPQAQPTAGRMSTGAIALDNLQGQTPDGLNYTLSRYVSFTSSPGYVKIADFLTDTDSRPGDRAYALRFTNQLQQGGQADAPMTDKDAGHLIVFTATDALGRVAIDIWGFKNAAVTPVTGVNGNSVQTMFTLNVPHGQTVGVVHYHGGAADRSGVNAMIADVLKTPAQAGVPEELASHLVNGSAAEEKVDSSAVATLGSDFQGDVVQLASGEQFRGTLQETSLTLRSPLGLIGVPFTNLSGIVANPSPRRVVTALFLNGDALSGRAQESSFHLKTQDDRVIELPVSQVQKVRLGRPIAATEPTTLQSTPMVRLIGPGKDVLSIVMPERILFSSRYGLIDVPGAAVLQIEFAASNEAAHRLILADGSSLVGMISSNSLSIVAPQLASSGLTVDVGSVRRLEWPKPAGPAATQPVTATLKTRVGDVLRGSLSQGITLLTDFGDIDAAADQLLSITLDTDSPGNVVVKLSDGRIFRGDVKQQDIALRLSSGVELHVPVGLIESYEAPAQPK